MESLNITVPSPDAIVLLKCPKCGREQAATIAELIRGTEYTCIGCAAQIESKPGKPRSLTAAVRIADKHKAQEFEFVLRTDGVWFLQNEAEKTILDVLDHDSDRAVAIIVGSMIERRLEQAILARSKRDEIIENRLFQPSGPLGPFSSKIDIAYLNGIISTAAHADLVIMKDIRNKFAHKLEIKDFRSQAIRDKAKNFKLIDEHVAQFDEIADQPQIANVAHGTKPTIWVRNAAVHKKRAKGRYLMTAQVLAVRLAPVAMASWPLPLI